jgi:hypothetical protein
MARYTSCLKRITSSGVDREQNAEGASEWPAGALVRPTDSGKAALCAFREAEHYGCNEGGDLHFPLALYNPDLARKTLDQWLLGTLPTASLIGFWVFLGTGLLLIQLEQPKKIRPGPV